MAGIGSMVEEEELVEYILVFLGSKCDPIVLAVIARHTAISISGLYSQLPAFETRRVLMNNEGGTSVNSASWAATGLVTTVAVIHLLEEVEQASQSRLQRRLWLLVTVVGIQI
jgi:hypothetical protein